MLDILTDVETEQFGATKQPGLLEESQVLKLTRYKISPGPSGEECTESERNAAFK